MKRFQGSYVSGSVEVKISGENPEHFLDICSKNGIMLWDISRHSMNDCIAKIKVQDISLMKSLRYGTDYKITFIEQYGLPFFKKRFLRKKPLLIGLIIGFIFFILLSNMVWQVKITGVPEEMESRINTQLESYGIHPGALKWTVPSPKEIQQLLMDDLPELLWVGVNLEGTSYTLQGVEKRIIESEEEGMPQNLIANKDGVIQSVYVENGQPEVKMNDYVEKGDLLVSGEIEKENGADEEEKEGSYERIRAEGEIRAITWYHVETSVPLETFVERLTGEISKEYKLQLGSFIFPIWPWKTEDYEQELMEQNKDQLVIHNWELPIHFITNKRYEAETQIKKMTKNEAVQEGVEQAKADLLMELDRDAEILSDKILHETFDRGKVNISLYITVEENIATGQTINQGD